VFVLLTVAVPAPEDIELPRRSSEAMERTRGGCGPACSLQVGPFPAGGVEDVKISDRAWPMLCCQEDCILDGQRIKSQYA
jgi:hypothetical protein